MKKLVLGSVLMLSTLAASAAPINPMDYYTPSEVKKSDVDLLWNSMRTDLKGKDCYRRAQLWTYEMNQRFKLDSMKIFIHYTNKLNYELDKLGKKNLTKFSRKFYVGSMKSKKQLTWREKGLVKYNVVWDYHVAPLVNVEGEAIVLDKQIKLPYDASFPYTEEEVDMSKEYLRPATVEEWLEGLSVNPERLWVIRRKELKAQIKDVSKKLSKETRKKRPSSSKVAKLRSELKEYQDKFVELGMDKADRIDIKCREITSMAELDAVQDKEWCVYSIAPMYYYNEIDLRNLAYGYIHGLNYAIPVDPKFSTEENHRNGAQYIQNSFSEAELKDAAKEIETQDHR